MSEQRPKVSVGSVIKQEQMCEWCKRGKHWRCTKPVTPTRCCCNGQPNLQGVQFDADKWDAFMEKVKERKTGLGTALEEAIEAWTKAEERSGGKPKH